MRHDPKRESTTPAFGSGDERTAMQSLVPMNSARPRSVSFLVSLCIHIAGVILLWQFAGPQTQFWERNRKPEALTFLATPPKLAAEVPRPKRIELRAPRLIAPEPPQLAMPEPPPDEAPRRIPEPAASLRPSLREAEAPPVPRPVPSPEAPRVRTNVFSSVESNPASNPAQRRSPDVQTGSFSGPVASMAANLHATSQVGAFQQIAASSTEHRPGRLDVAMGGFGRPVAGPATAPQGQVQTVPSGFGDSAPRAPARSQTLSALAPSTGGFGETVRSTPPPLPKAVRDGAFGTVAAAAPQTAAPKPGADLEPTTAVEILYKPRPEYTQEGRKRQIEGEVLLEALFSAKGELQVLRVIRGLGYGLDETALAAARAIRFRPALHRGLPIDSVATVRITFQLAY